MKKKITYMSIVWLSKSLETMKLWAYSKETGKLVKLLSLLATEMKEYESIRVSILERLTGWKKKENGNYDFDKGDEKATKENEEQRSREYKELLDTEVEIELPSTSIDISKVAWLNWQEVMALYSVFGDFIVL